jgi:hypothetical protein
LSLWKRFPWVKHLKRIAIGREIAPLPQMEKKEKTNDLIA